MNLDQGVQTFDPIGLVRRRGKLAAVIAGGVMLIAFWIAMALPNMYSSYAVILVEPQSVDEDLVDSGVRKSDLRDRLGLMASEILSRSRLSSIITELDLYKDENDMQRFEVVQLMRSFVRVEPVTTELEETRGSRNQTFRTFKVVFDNENPDVAKAVAQRIANDFINENINKRTEITAKSLDFMQDEIGSLTTALTTVERSIGKVKEENAGRLPQEFDAHQRRLEYAMGGLRDAQRAFDGAENDAAFWANQALTVGSLGGSNGPVSPTYRVSALKIELGSLFARGYTEKHPDVMRNQAELVILENQIETEGSEPDMPLTAGEQNARAQQARSELHARAAAVEMTRFKETITDLQARLAATPAVAEQLDALKREYDHLYLSYQDFSARLQQAGVQADLERRQLGEKFRILESAERARQPSSPNRFMLLVLGAILGLMLGGGVALISELTDSSIHSSTSLQAALGIPVLVSVPNIMLESDRVLRSRRIFRETALAAGVVFFVLIGGVATYLVVNDNRGIQANEEIEESAPAPAATAIEARADSGTRRG